MAGTVMTGAAFAQTTTVTDFVYEAENGTVVTIPLIEAVDANLDADQIRTILMGEDPDAASRIAGLTAASISIPEVHVAYDYSQIAEGETGEMVYRDFVLSDVVDGVAGSSLVGSFELIASDGTTASFGEISTGRFDIGTTLMFYELVEGPELTEPVPIYNDFAFAGGSFSTEDADCEIGAFTSTELRGRPLEMSMSELETMALEMEQAEQEGEEPSPAAIGRLVAFYADYLTAFESGPSIFEGLTCSGVTDEGNPILVTVGQMDFEPYIVGEPTGFSMRDISIEVENDGFIRLGYLGLRDVDVAPVLEAIAAAGDLSAGWPEEQFAQLLPRLGALSLGDFEMDIPDEDNEGARIRASLADFLTWADSYVNGIPTEVGIEFNGLTVPVDATSDNEMFQQLTALGYSELSLGFRLGMRWDADAETLHVDQLAFGGDNLGVVELSASARNAGEALFSGDQDEMLAAAMALAVTELDIIVTDDGLRRRLIEMNAQAQGQDVATFTAAMSMMAQGAAAGMLAGSDAAAPVGRALGAFIGGAAPELHLSLTAREDAGIGMAQFMALQEDPSLLSQIIDIEAGTSGTASPGEDTPPPPPGEETPPLPPGEETPPPPPGEETPPPPPAPEEPPSKGEETVDSKD